MNKIFHSHRDQDPIIIHDNKKITLAMVIKEIKKTTHEPHIIYYSKKTINLTQILACIYAEKSFLVIDNAWPKSYIKQYETIIKNCTSLKKAIFIPTSGSTGHPKLVHHTIASIIKSAKRALNHHNILKTDHCALALSPASMGGLLTIIKGIISKSLIISTSDHWGNVLDDSNHWQINIVPQQLDWLLTTNKIHTLKLSSILIGGDAINKETKKTLKKLSLPIIYSYGSTETAGQIISTALNKKNNTYMPLRGVKLSENNQQLMIKTDTIALGYITINGVEPLPSMNGYFLSNDLIKMPPQFEVIGRKDFQFQSGSKLVSPEIIEKTLLKSNIITHIIVVPKKHPQFGHVPVAYISTTTSIDSLVKYANSHLPIFMQPKDYLPLPKNLSFSDLQCRKKLINLKAQYESSNN